ncbi:MAG: hypothetical protein GY725_05215 [bacterium]|nr:hypothetical protein [bacterium]
MKRRDQRQLDEYRDGVLSGRERERINADPELREQLNLDMGLGALVKETWTEGPPAPKPENLISVLRPAMAQIDAEIAAASPWARMREWWSEALTPAPVAALVGVAALLMLAVLPDGAGDVSPELLRTNVAAVQNVQQAMDQYANTEVRTIASVVEGLTASADDGPSVYDLGQGKDPLMLFESDDATVIWVLPDGSISQGTNGGGWV